MQENHGNKHNRGEKYCYKDKAIQVYHENATINAFLTQDKIIRATSKRQTCKSNYQNIHIIDSKRLTVKQGNKISIENGVLESLDSIYKQTIFHV